ncbi:hypothetical protein [Streptomyces celluloflavus]
MVRKAITIYAGDLTGEESSEVANHPLSLDCVTYEIVLGSDSCDRLN